MGRYIGDTWVDRPNPIRPRDLKRLRRRVRKLYGSHGTVKVVPGHGSTPSMLEIWIGNVRVAECEMRHHEGDVVDVLPSCAREVVEIVRIQVADAREARFYAKARVREAERELRGAQRALAIVQRAVATSRKARTKA